MLSLGLCSACSGRRFTYINKLQISFDINLLIMHEISS
jgi:hypothetical protein